MILKYKCAICNNKVFETRKKLCTHIQSSHKIAGKLCAERNGYKIYYIWEHDVNECYSECLSKCKLALEGKI